MSQATHDNPSVVVNGANSRQQVPLRDYLNARVAPFLKKAVTESLGVEAEFPLQWLGECLIHQSILYEGNPDRTNIRERFVYKFETPAPQEDPPAASAPTEPSAVQQHENEPERPQVDIQESSVTASEPPAATERSADLQDAPATNGVKDGDDQNEQDATRDGDTEMGGIS